jgi:hypothetical protein
MSSGGGSQTTVQKTEPPAYVKPYILGTEGKTGVLPEAQALYQSGGARYYPESTVAGFSPEQMMGLTMGTNRAMSGSPLNAAAGGYIQDSIAGNYLGGNPAEDALYQSLSARITPQVNAQFSSAGRYGSGAHSGAMAQGLMNAYAPYAFQDYGRERALQQQAAMFAPTLAGEDYKDINAMMGYGAMTQGMSQAQLSDAVNRWNHEQNAPQQNLANYANYVYGFPGGTTTSTGPSNQPSPFQTAMGGLLGIGSLFI